MKSNTLSQEEYFRPRRAGELERKAERLDWCYRRLPWVMLATWLVLVWGACVLQDLLQVELVSFCPYLLLSGAFIELFRVRADRCRREARVLRREHQARYGSIPDPSRRGG